MKNLILLLTFILFGLVLSAQTESKKNQPPKTLSEKQIKVFPNPATTVINVLGLINSTKANISISDIHGNEVIKHQWAIRNKALNIPIPNLEVGIYVIRIHSKEQQFQTKFYKQ